MPTTSLPPLLECVPNFSEGRDRAVIDRIAEAIRSIPDVKLLHIDIGVGANRTVMTFAGPPEAVVDAAYAAIATAARYIDMRYHQGAHPRLGATDVCPLIPLGSLTMEEAVKWANILAERVGNQLDLPVYLYEHSATRSDRRLLADIRRGEYEGLPLKMISPEDIPDFGPREFNEYSGATVIGARDFLLAYNVNLNTTSVRLANKIAARVRESGRRVRQADGSFQQVPGRCQATRAIGWFIEEYGTTQVSTNLTDYHQTNLHEVFTAIEEEAQALGVRVTGSELIGLVPLEPLLDAGRYFLQKQGRSPAASEAVLIEVAVRSLGLNEFDDFIPGERILEYILQELPASPPLTMLPLAQFADRVASDRPTPGGGTTAAAIGALAAALGSMTANISIAYQRDAGLRQKLIPLAEQTARLQQSLLDLADEDSRVYNLIVEGQRLPRKTEAQRNHREQVLQHAFQHATDLPLLIMEQCADVLELCTRIITLGRATAIPDAGAGAYAAAGALRAASMSVVANLPFLEDKAFVRRARTQKKKWMNRADTLEQIVAELVEKHSRQ